MAAEPRRASDHALPRRVGRYDAFLQIGAGGMARVYLAVVQGQPGQAQLAVVKILRPEAVEDEHVLALFMDEARISMRLQHPNVIRTREVVAEPPDYMLAMDFVNGQSLLQVLRRIERHAVPLDEHIFILSKVLAGLSYAHALRDSNGQPFGIVHRDVSPANVLVSYTGEVKLLDFGIAKATGALAATQDGVVKGKLGYAAPEQCLGKPADPRSDIYAVGVMLWEAIAGRRRATGETWHSVLQARLEDAEPQLEEVCPDAPKALMAIARKALAHEPEDRYRTAREFHQDLDRYLGEQQGTKVGPARIAAMLKPHFDQDRKDQQRSIEEFLGKLRSGGSGQHRRVPLPGGTAALPAPAAPPGPRPTAPVVEEEQTSRIPVDTALLIMSRNEAAAPDSKSSLPTSLPLSQASFPMAPPQQTPKAPPALKAKTPPPLTPKTPPALPKAATAQSSAATAAPQSAAANTAPTAPPQSATPPSNDVSASAPALAPASSLRTPFPRPTADAYGIITLPKADAASHPLASVADVAPPKKKTRHWPVMLVVGGAVGLAAAGVVSFRKTSSYTTAAPQRASDSEQTPATAPAPRASKADTVNVRISVDPADAVVKLDGRVLSNNPFVTTLPRDNDVHVLTAYAEGCRDAKQVVHLNQDVDMLLALKRLKGFVRSTAPRAAAAGAAARAAAAASAPVLLPQPATPPHPEKPAVEPGLDLKGLPSESPAKRADEENPYGQ